MKVARLLDPALLLLLTVLFLVGALFSPAGVFALPEAKVTEDPFRVPEQTTPSVYLDKVVWREWRSQGAWQLYSRDMIATNDVGVGDGWTNQWVPDIFGNVVTWVDSRGDGYDIYMRDLSSGGDVAVSTASGQQWAPRLSSSYVVWEDQRSGADRDIYARALSGGDEITVSVAGGNQRRPAIWGNRVAWFDDESWPTPDKVWAMDLPSGEPTFVAGDSTASAANPAIYQDRIVWERTDNSGGGTSIWMKDMGTGLSSEVASANPVWPKQYPQIYGDWVAWLDYRTGQAEVWAKNLVSQEETQVTHGSDWGAYSLRLSGNRLVWQRGLDGVQTVFTKLLGDDSPPTRASNYMVPSEQSQVTADGDRIAWRDTRNGYSDIYYRNLSGGGDVAVTNDSWHQENPCLSGDSLLWADHQGFDPPTTGEDIRMKNLISGDVSWVCTATSTQNRPVASGDWAAWWDYRAGTHDIWTRNLAGGDETPVSWSAGPKQEVPAISGNVVVWGELRDIGQSDIFAKDLTTGVESTVASGPDNQWYPSISGDRVVWVDQSALHADLWTRALPSGEATLVTQQEATQTQPNISGDIIAWIDDRNGYKQVFAKNLASGEETALTTETSAQPEWPKVSGDKVFWTDYREGDADIFMKSADMNAPSASVTAPVLGGSSGFTMRWSASDASPSSGIDTYDVGRKANMGGVWGDWTMATTSTSMWMNGTQGVTYYFRARARDKAGNEGAWSAEKYFCVPYDQGRMKFGGAWSTARSTSFYGRSTRYSSTRGRYALLGVSGARSIAVLGTRRYTGGYAYVYLNGRLTKTISFYSRTTQVRVPLAVVTFAAPTTKTVKVVVAGRKPRASRGYRVEIDGLVVRR
ncbi:MAG: hypothetical protein C4521_08430 [Actinobacteria bacterium]|nr:MAG: hypothetical protein C4521_08430 [Actinomycetota bacterium]